MSVLTIVRTISFAPHRYDHVVIVVAENRSPTQIIGDRVNAPYINSLADNGVRIRSMFVTANIGKEVRHSSFV